MPEPPERPKIPPSDPHSEEAEVRRARQLDDMMHGRAPRPSESRPLPLPE